MQYDLIILEAGHGGKDLGAVSNGIREKDVVLRWVISLNALLKERGCKTALVRDSDFYESPAAKAAKANKLAKDLGAKNPLFLSFHNNSYSKSSANGFENFVARTARTETIILARNIAVELVKAVPALGPLRQESGSPYPGVKKRGFTVLNNTSMQAILLEIGFISNTVERAIIADKGNDEKLMTVVADQICLGQAHSVPVVIDYDEQTFLDGEDEGLLKGLLVMLSAAEWQFKKMREFIQEKLNG